MQSTTRAAWGSRDFTWSGRHPVTPALYVSSALIGLAAIGSSAYSAKSALEAGLGAGMSSATFILPLYLCAAWGLAHDAEVEQCRRLGGRTLDVQRVRMVASVSAIGLGGALLAVALAFVAAVIWQDPAPSLQVETHLVRTGTRLALLLLAVVTLSIIAAYDRSLVAGLSAGVGILLTHLAVQFTPDIVGQAGLKLIWPPTGATAVSEAGRNYTSTQGLVAMGALLAYVVWAIARLSRSAVHDRPRGNEPIRGWAAGTGLRQVIVACGLLIVLTPTIIRLGLPTVPPAARPSILLQQSQDQAPDQVAAEFFGDLQNGLLQGARSRVSTSESALIENLPRAVFVRGPSQTFQLERLIGIDRAEVTAYLVAGKYLVCLKNSAGTWQIESIGAARC